MEPVDGLLLIGSLPYESTEAVFDAIPQDVMNNLAYIPDGETGSRSYFVKCQQKVFHPRFWWGREKQDHTTVQYLLSACKTGYDEAALDSYKSFKLYRSQGLIPSTIRFQISLPNPLNALWACVDFSYRSSEIEPWYERGIIESLSTIQQQIPVDDLAIQWDCAIDFAYMEYEGGRLQDDLFKPPFTPAQSGSLDRLVKVSTHVDPRVKLGYHLCYGDMGHQHFIKPDSLRLMIDYANDLVTRMETIHHISWIHMPVPKDIEDEEAYFEPLQSLNLRGAKLYLGLIHANDEEGTKRRIRAASEKYPTFGVATECGLGRTPAAEIGSIFAISSAVCK